MTAYAIGHLHRVEMGPDIVAYLNGIDATLAPFGGRFLIHGTTPQVLEGAFAGDLIVIVFPDMRSARGWYASDAYQAILPLRLSNCEGDVLLMQGVEAVHKATDILSAGRVEA